MSELKARIQEDMKAALRAQDKPRLGAIRLITAAIKQIEVDERIELDNARVITVLGKMSKQRKESIEQFKKAGRDDLVNQEVFELDIIATYLPEPLADAEIDKILADIMTETGANSMKDMGQVMAALKAKTEGRADMGKLSAKVKAALSN